MRQPSTASAHALERLAQPLVDVRFLYALDALDTASPSHLIVIYYVDPQDL